ncbi:MAG: hypothetical protein ABI056_02995 [Caulobacteraceae bacterium]
MRTWFGRPAAPAEERLDAYKEGRTDERARLRDPALAPAATVADRAAINEAYERGRREEGLRRRGSPLLGFITLVLVIIALAVLILAIRAGSFAGAGAQIDNLLQRPVHNAADRAGNALQNAGRSLKDNAGSSQP